MEEIPFDLSSPMYTIVPNPNQLYVMAIKLSPELLEHLAQNKENNLSICFGSKQVHPPPKYPCVFAILILLNVLSSDHHTGQGAIQLESKRGRWSERLLLPTEQGRPIYIFEGRRRKEEAVPSAKFA